MIKRVITVKQVCERLGCSIPFVYDLMNAGEIESYNQGRARKIVETSVGAYQERQLKAAQAKRRARAA
jgi:excisionase family DNA binding protein